MRVRALVPLIAALSVSAAVASETLSRWEYELARTYDISPNQAVASMTPERYRQALARLHPSVSLSQADREKAVEFGAAQQRKGWGSVGGRWKRGGTQAWPPAADLAQLGWAKGDEAPEVRKKLQALPDHYLAFTVDHRADLPDGGGGSGFRQSADLRFALKVGEKEHAPAGEPGEDFKSQRYAYTSTSTDVNCEACRGGRGRRRRGGDVPHTCQRSENVSGTEFEQSFRVVFDLLNADGTPRIAADADQVELVMYYRGKPSRQRFALKDWVVPELRAKK
jgi:hypothetical protein